MTKNLRALSLPPARSVCQHQTALPANFGFEVTEVGYLEFVKAKFEAQMEFPSTALKNLTITKKA